MTLLVTVVSNSSSISPTLLLNNLSEQHIAVRLSPTIENSVGNTFNIVFFELQVAWRSLRGRVIRRAHPLTSTDATRLAEYRITKSGSSFSSTRIYELSNEPNDPSFQSRFVDSNGNSILNVPVRIPKNVDMSESRSLEILPAIQSNNRVIYGNPVDVDSYHKIVENTWRYISNNETDVGNYYTRLRTVASSNLPDIVVRRWETSSELQGFRDVLIKGHRTGGDGTIQDNDIFRVAYRIAEYTGLRPQDVLALWAKEGGLASPNVYAVGSRWKYLFHVERNARTSVSNFTAKFRARARAAAFWLGCGADMYNEKMPGGQDGYPEVRLGHVDVNENHFKTTYRGVVTSLTNSGVPLACPTANAIVDNLHKGISVREQNMPVVYLGPDVPAIGPVFSDTFNFLLVLCASLRLRQLSRNCGAVFGRDLDLWSASNNSNFPIFWAELAFHGGAQGAKNFYDRIADDAGLSSPIAPQRVYEQLATLSESRGLFADGFYRFRLLWIFFDYIIKQVGWSRQWADPNALVDSDPFYYSDRPTP